MNLHRNIYHNDYVLIDHYRYLHEKETEKIRLFTMTKRYSLKDIKDQATYRTINHWDLMGLLDSEREMDGQWRKFNLIDLVWIQVIAELRRFGFPLEKIKKAKQTLFYYEQKPEIKSQYFDLYVIYGLMKNQIYVLVFDDGSSEVALEGEYESANDLYTLDSHIVIDLSKILRKLLPKFNFAREHSFKEKVNYQELTLLNLMRNGKYESITVRFKDGKPDLFEGKESVSNQKRIVEILKENKYQDIEIVQANGKIVKISRTEKEKL